MAARRASVDEELARLAAATEGPHSAPGQAALAQGLASKHARVVAAAAQRIRSRTLEGHGAALQAAYARFLDDPVKRDPGCRAKLAVLEALDFTESMDEVPFLGATALVQLEPAWGPPIDTAAPVRARAVLALARLAHPDLVLVAGTLLADPEAPVRLAAADALGSAGVRPGAGLLLHKLAVGDEDPLVLLSCMSGVLTLAPEVALARFTPWLGERDGQRRELAALCLGQSGRADAGQALLAALEACTLSADRPVLLRALGLHRSDAALEALMGLLASGSEADARASARALAPRRFEPGLRARAARAVAGRPALERELEAVFREPTP